MLTKLIIIFLLRDIGFLSSICIIIMSKKVLETSTQCKHPTKEHLHGHCCGDAFSWSWKLSHSSEYEFGYYLPTSESLRYIPKTYYNLTNGNQVIY